MSNDFCVGFRGEFVTFFDEPFLKCEIVFDDPVVNYDYSSGAIAVRMSVFFCGTSVRSPPGVANAVGAFQRFVADDLFQIPKLAFCTADLKSIPIPGDSNARGVVPAILKLTQSLDDHGDNALLTYISNNATHTRIFLSSKPFAVLKNSILMDASC